MAVVVACLAAFRGGFVALFSGRLEGGRCCRAGGAMGQDILPSHMDMSESLQRVTGLCQGAISAVNNELEVT